MTLRLSRRGILKIGAVSAGSAILGLSWNSWASEAATATELPGLGLTAYQEGPQIWVRWNNEILTSYRAHATQKYPYFYPLAGPLSGLSLTTESSLPWPHHRSMLFACDRVNRGNYWQGPVTMGQIVSQGPQLGQVTSETVEILDECRWAPPGGEVVMSDRRRFVVCLVAPNVRWIDADITWQAEKDVTIEKTNHSLFAVRAAPDITPLGGGQLVNAEGLSGEKETFGKPSAWCCYWGERQRPKPGTIEGIALFDHPANPWAPTPWFTRDYGFISPTPFYFIQQPWLLAAGQSVRLRYRVVFFGGEPAEVQLARIYEEWAKT
jgi:hypothetical protein